MGSAQSAEAVYNNSNDYKKTEQNLNATYTNKKNNESNKTNSLAVASPNTNVSIPASYANFAEDVVPTVFKWDHGGRNVYITGTFNNWERQLPMHKSGNDFTYIFNLKKGKHAYKFIVDDEWRFAPDQPTVADNDGRINNFIDVSNFAPYTGDEQFFYKSKEMKIPLELYNQHIPELGEYNKEPPTLPPHLRHIILNKPNPTSDLLSLPTPQHVALNHLYCTAIKDNVMVLGATQRYRDKSVTIVFYAVMPAPTSSPSSVRPPPPTDFLKQE